jgi:hypothetical protein
VAAHRKVSGQAGRQGVTRGGGNLTGKDWRTFNADASVARAELYVGDTSGNLDAEGRRGSVGMVVGYARAPGRRRTDGPMGSLDRLPGDCDPDDRSADQLAAPAGCASGLPAQPGDEVDRRGQHDGAEQV